MNKRKAENSYDFSRKKQKIQVNYPLIYSRDNHVYFYSEINQKSINNLKNEISISIKRSTNITNNLLAFGLVVKCPPIVVHICSPGGNVFAALHFIGFILDIKRKNPFFKFHSIIDGNSSSNAILISVIFDEKFIKSNVQISIHELSFYAWGNFLNFINKNISINSLKSTIFNIYKKFSNIPDNELAYALVNKIIWDAQSCLKYGIVNTIIK